jgi:CRISPR system Cascade subunit CasB
VVGLAAHVKADAGSATSFGRQMAEAVPGSGRARVSGLRFRRLVAEEERESLYLLLVRVVHLLNGTINLADMARSLYRWDDMARRQWAYDYYAAGPKNEK